MRKRVINADALYNDAKLVQALGPRGRGIHLYICLWCMAEDWGGYEYDPSTIRNRLGSLNFTLKEVEKYIEILREMKKIVAYSAQDGRKMHWLKNFLRHQRLNNPPLPHLPLPEWITYTIHKTKSEKVYAKFYIQHSSLPVDYRAALGSLPVGSRKGQETEKETDREKDIDTKGRGPVGPPGSDTASKETDLMEREEFERLKPHIQKLCTELMEHFDIRWKWEKGTSTKGRFHPIWFVFNARKSGIPVSVIVQVLESMARQREQIVNPYAWLLSVLKSEHQNYNFNEHLREHEAQKGGLARVSDLVKGVMRLG